MSVSETRCFQPTKCLRSVMEYIERIDVFNLRMCLRAESILPAEIHSINGSRIKATTRDISVAGIGFVHRERVSLGEAHVTVFSRDQEFHYLMEIAWCRACENGTFMSGGRFLKDSDVESEP